MSYEHSYNISLWVTLVYIDYSAINNIIPLRVIKLVSYQTKFIIKCYIIEVQKLAHPIVVYDFVKFAVLRLDKFKAFVPKKKKKDK